MAAILNDDCNLQSLKVAASSVAIEEIDGVMKEVTTDKE